MNTPLSARVRQLQLTLERWRWAPRVYNPPPILVNIPEFILRGFGKGETIEMTMKVVVGRSYRAHTPVFSQEMSYLVFRPYWNVPLAIQRGELVPREFKKTRTTWRRTENSRSWTSMATSSPPRP